MNKLSLIQIMNLADKLNQAEWIATLIKLNNNNQIEHFFEFIEKTDMLEQVLTNTTVKKAR